MAASMVVRWVVAMVVSTVGLSVDGLDALLVDGKAAWLDVTQVVQRVASMVAMTAVHSVCCLVD